MTWCLNKSLRLTWEEGVQEDFNIIPTVVAITQLVVEGMVELEHALLSVKIGTVAIPMTQLALMLSLVVL